MVWVSNRGVKPIHVSITNASGGSDKGYDVSPQSEVDESVRKNLWRRKGQETLGLLREGGKEQTLVVGPNDFVRVYPDALIVSQANVFEA